MGLIDGAAKVEAPRGGRRAGAEAEGLGVGFRRDALVFFFFGPEVRLENFHLLKVEERDTKKRNN